MRKLIITLAVLFMLMRAFVPGLMAHGGEDHGEEQKTFTTTAYFSSEKSSEKYEVLLKYGELEPGKEVHLKLFVSNVISNEPISGAKIKLSNPDQETQRFEVVEKEAGIYEVHTVFPKKGTYSLNVFLDAVSGADLIKLSGIETGKALPQSEIDGLENVSSGNFSYLYILLALLAGLLLGLFIRRKSVAGKTGISIFLLIVFVFSPYHHLSLNAHGDEEHGVKRKSDSGSNNQIIIEKETQFLFDVRTMRTGQRNFSPSVNLFGTVMPTSYGRAVIQAPQAGIIRSLKVEVGQSVRKGDLLATLEQNIDAGTNVSWLTQQSALNAELKAASKEYERLKGLSDIVSKKELDEAERRYTTAVENLAEFRKLNSQGNGNSKINFLYAPISGRVDNFNLIIGSTLSAGQEVLSITDISTVYVEAQVFDKDAERVKAGKEFMLECSGMHSTRKVKPLTVTPSINVSNQSQRVLFEVENSEGEFKIGEFVNIRVFNEQSARELVLPNSAITEINGKPAVFVKISAEQYSLVYISTGENNGMYTTVLNGLDENQTVVTNATYQLKMIHLNQ